ncbi:MAG: hypothetical protein ABI697_07900 [Devosia sp.]
MAALRRIPVSIIGEYQPVAYVGQVRWEGIVTAKEPITALVLRPDSKTIQWSRAHRHETDTLKIVLAVFPEDGSENRYDVRIHLNIGSGGLVLTMKLSSTAPFMFSLDHHVTSEPAWFARPWTKDDRFDLGALFVATADTRSARNHLWHLRGGIVPPDGFAEALEYGRAGQIAR